MKELTIEQKAKRYDEALKVLHKYDSANIMFSQSLKEEMFPELKESKGDRIRKSIICVLKQYFIANAVFDGFSREDMITWLEKQGEQKLTPIFRIGDTIIAKDGTYIEKEPFHIDRIEDDCYWDGENTILVCNQDEFKIFKKKPAEWSPEDEIMQKAALEILMASPKLVASTILKESVIDWLKSLKDRVQPVQEWNGGDDAHIHSIITHLQDFIESHPNTTGADIQGENVAWLKSLRPRSYWKPSKEHMEALEHFVRSIGESGYASPYDNNTKLLYSLLSDLKKLREK